MADYQQMDMPEFPKNGKKIILTVVIGLVVLILMFKSVQKIDGGEGGVLYRANGGIDVENTYSEGYTLIAPWNDLIIYNVRQQEVLEDMAVLSSNGLEITLEVSAWYQPRFKELGKLHQEKGQDYLNQVIKPAITDKRSLFKNTSSS